MRKCCGTSTREWGADAIFDVTCGSCGHPVEFFKDEITRHCPHCRAMVHNDRKAYGCGQWCSASSTHRRNLCPKFRRAKDRFYGHVIA